MTESIFHKVIDISNKTPTKKSANSVQLYSSQQYFTPVNTNQFSQLQQTPSTENTPIQQHPQYQFPQTPQQNQQNSGQVNQKERQNNSFCSNGSRRFSFFSKTSFATSNSLNFGIKRLKSHHVPRVNITNIIKKRAYLYLDQDLAYTFDELLENGYEMVLNKKHERDTLKELEENLKSECQEVEKEVVPLIGKMFKLKDALAFEENLKKKYEYENNVALQEMEQLRQQIIQRTQEIQREQNEINQNINQLEQENNNIRSQILINKNSHKMERDNHESFIKIKKSELDQSCSLLSSKKNLADEKKMDQAQRLRKMENKSKMYLGILKH